jgi:hypothetical protein
VFCDRLPVGAKLPHCGLADDGRIQEVVVIRNCDGIQALLAASPDEGVSELLTLVFR